ncbi:MAG: hypothetical protein JNL70_00575 [Saprospiraceae bacterium]|nr:hypothetical protein [Saprospiraceae bacterium]
MNKERIIELKQQLLTLEDQQGQVTQKLESKQKTVFWGKMLTYGGLILSVVFLFLGSELILITLTLLIIGVVIWRRTKSDNIEEEVAKAKARIQEVKKEIIRAEHE